MTFDRPTSVRTQASRRFGRFTLDPATFALWREEEPSGEHRVALPPKAFDILELFTRNVGVVMSPSTILKALWPQAYVQPEVIKGHILVIRAALDDSHEKPIYIESIRGRGYRFIAAVRILSESRGSPGVSLVGRDPEMDRLLSMLDGDSDRGFRMAFVSGEPGIGKTGLVTAFTRVVMARRPDLATATGCCLEVPHRMDAFHPVLEAVTDLGRGAYRETLLSILWDVAPTWLAALSDFLSAETLDRLRSRTAGATWGRTLREGAALLERIARDIPLVLVLEDLQWVDEATIGLLSTLYRRRPSVSLLVIGTCRLSDARARNSPLLDLRARLLPDPCCTDLVMKPVDLPAAKAFLRYRAGERRVAQDLASAVHERSGGNPLFMGLIVDHLIARGLIVQSTRGWRLRRSLEDIRSTGLPATLSEAVELRVQRLGAAEQQVLELGSLSEQDFSASLHGCLEGIDPEAFESLCDTLASHTDLIQRRGASVLPSGDHIQAYRFQHPLFRDVLLARQGASRLARRRRALAHRLETVRDQVVTSFAAHSEANGDRLLAEKAGGANR